MAMFFYMCEYLDVTPCEFFKEELLKDIKVQELAPYLSKLTPAKLEALKSLLETFIKK